MRIVTGIALLVCCVLLGVVHADDGDASVKTIVYIARNAPANVLADTLEQFLKESGGRVVTDPFSNVLLIQTAAENHKPVIAVLQQLDRTPSTFRMQLHLLKTRGEALAESDTDSLSGPTDEALNTIERLKAAGRVTVANRIELTAVENQPAFLQVGEDVPLPSATMTVPGRGASTNYRSVAVGLMFSVQARLSGESDVVSEIDFEKSAIDPPRVNAEEEASPAPPGVSRLTLKTTTRIQDGHSLLLGGLVDQSTDRDGAAYLVLSASIANSQQTKQVALPQSPSRKPALDDPRYLAYFGKLVERYDEDNDKALDADERAKMPKDCSDADTDKDGLVTVAELMTWTMTRKP